MTPVQTIIYFGYLLPLISVFVFFLLVSLAAVYGPEKRSWAWILNYFRKGGGTLPLFITAMVLCALLPLFNIYLCGLALSDLWILLRLKRYFRVRYIGSRIARLNQWLGFIVDTIGNFNGCILCVYLAVRALIEDQQQHRFENDVLWALAWIIGTLWVYSRRTEKK